MNREQYLQMRNSNQIGNIIYSTYVKLCDKRKIQSYNPEIFFKVFNHWGLAQYYVNEILYQLDIQFKVIEISKNNKIIKLL